MKIRMSNAEIALLQGLLTAARSYLEFGMGGSTILASQLVAGPIYAIESDAEWIEKVRAASRTANLQTVFADIGPTGHWGMPLDRSQPEKFYNYHRKVFDGFPEKCDLYLIDGRFRVACFAISLLNMRSDSVIAIHDYRPRTHYHIIDTVGRPIIERETLTVFVRRPEIDDQQIRELFEAYKFDPA